MNFDIVRETFQVREGMEITLETGKLARQADGAVVLRCGKTMLLATVVSAKELKSGTDFFPLTVDYREKYSSSGKFPGGFFKREARPTDNEILISRLIDRALRPMFPENYRYETQILVSLISAEKNVMPDALAGLAASAAIAVSDIPMLEPISEVRVAKINGEYILNPNLDQMVNSTLDIIVAGSAKNILMVEGEMKEVSEKEMLEAIQVAHQAIQVQCAAQVSFASKVTKAQVKREVPEIEGWDEIKEKVFASVYDKLYNTLKQGGTKAERKNKIKAIKEELMSSLSEEDLENAGLYSAAFYEAEWVAARRLVLDEKIRLDGRKTNDIRPIDIEIDYLPSTHGSALFTRGETQALATVTLGSKLDEQLVDGVLQEGTQKFMLHYNFPPFSTGEVKPMRGLSRREVGHGNLAYRALAQVIPGIESNPYTIRIISDVLESNGSSSMATVCSGSLALMDAGIKIKSHVSGIAMGLITDEQGKYAILSDILGDEDHLGDMDFKVAGTREGITAVQMDMKVSGLSQQILEEALEQARQGRLHILDLMEQAIPQPKEDYKPHAPRIVVLEIPKEFIGAVIGPGGKIIQEMQAKTRTTITIEEVGNIGRVEICSDSKDGIEEVKAIIKGITTVPEVGEVYRGKVVQIVSFGAFVEFLPGKQGLLHISEIEWKRLEKVEEVLKEGDVFDVKLIGIDEKTGKFKLSRRALLPRPEKKETSHSKQ